MSTLLEAILTATKDNTARNRGYENEAAWRAARDPDDDEERD